MKLNVVVQDPSVTISLSFAEVQALYDQIVLLFKNRGGGWHNIYGPVLGDFMRSMYEYLQNAPAYLPTRPDFDVVMTRALFESLRGGDRGETDSSSALDRFFVELYDVYEGHPAFAHAYSETPTIL